MSVTVTEAVAKTNKVGTTRSLQEPQQTRLSLPTFRKHNTSGFGCCFVLLLVYENLCRAKEVFPRAQAGSRDLSWNNDILAK